MPSPLQALRSLLLSKVSYKNLTLVHWFTREGNSICFTIGLGVLVERHARVRTHRTVGYMINISNPQKLYLRINL